MAAAIGGMLAPALIYVALIPAGPWSHGWGVPMATDTAFAVALIAMMGARVPVELRIFLTAAAIVDDIGAIVVVALFYSGELHLGYLAAAAAVVGLLALLNRWRVYCGDALQPARHRCSGSACTRPGCTRRSPACCWRSSSRRGRRPTCAALVAQANAILNAEARRSGEVLHAGPSLPALRALDAIHDRLESPADRLLRHAGARSSYLVLPVFALANAGVALAPGVVEGRGALMLAIAAGLAVGKPLGLVALSALAVRLGLAVKPDAYSGGSSPGPGALAGIGFTMSLFIAGQAFADPGDFAAAKLAVFGASVVSALVGVGVLWRAPAPEERHAEAPAGSPA